ncbi:FAD-dependent oxidoreductase [Massilia sp. MB5]|uniref:flavin monoamine oxidase family protein n=1 Tax=Massilia sp. MB5 TaxID=2919578 RepID=UPI001F0EA444|nr:NAD(P)/FAD-dependent oxidoreductase [Massilia sp. MB5]UMR29424.1 FAD-dependent oxidoreductase [Massilia sp. MB5]
MDEQIKGTSRRGFLRATGAGAVAVAGVVVGDANAAKAGKCKSAGCDYDVVVIGGGFAGITAARDSRKSGYKTLVLEARNRLGGRTFSSTFAGHNIELGGAWIHWAQPNVWAEKERYGLEVKETPEGLDLSAEIIVLAHEGGRTVLNEQDMASIGEAFEQYFAEARQMWERPYDSKHTRKELIARDSLSVGDRLQSLQLSKTQRVALEGYFSTMGLCDIGKMSYNDVAHCWSLAGWSFGATNDVMGRYVFKTGTASLINAMLEDGKPEVRLSTPVRRIEDKGDRVIVTTQKGERIVARTAIVALPMNVLPSVEFSPPADPMVIEAGRLKHAGAGAKVYIKTRGKYDGAGKTLGVGDSKQAISLTFTYAKGDDHSIYVAFVPDPEKLDVQDTRAVQEALRVYIPDAVVEECFAYEWTLDPYSRGTWSAYRPNWYGKYLNHFEQDRGNIFFGQGDHGEGWRGFIDGAIGAGSRAAQRVRKVLG